MLCVALAQRLAAAFALEIVEALVRLVRAEWAYALLEAHQLLTGGGAAFSCAAD
jgi:hypothetical protein